MDKNKQKLEEEKEIFRKKRAEKVTGPRTGYKYSTTQRGIFLEKMKAIDKKIQLLTQPAALPVPVLPAVIDLSDENEAVAAPLIVRTPRLDPPALQAVISIRTTEDPRDTEYGQAWMRFRNLEPEDVVSAPTPFIPTSSSPVSTLRRTPAAATFGSEAAMALAESAAAVATPQAVALAGNSSPDNSEETHMEVYSQYPAQNAARHNLLAFLAEKRKDDAELNRLMAVDQADCKRTGTKFNTKHNNYRSPNPARPYGDGKSLDSDLKKTWKSNRSTAHATYDAKPSTKEHHRERMAALINRRETLNILYIAAVVHSSNAAFATLRKAKDWAGILRHPASKIELYPGKWTSRAGMLCMRTTHFVLDDGNHQSTIQDRLLELGDRAVCLELLAIPCEEAPDAEQGEGFLMAYGKEWMRSHPDVQPSFILTTPASWGYQRNQNRAIKLAREGVKLFEIVSEDQPRHPPPYPSLASLEDVMRLPYRIHSSQIIERWIVNPLRLPNRYLNIGDPE